MNWAPPQPDANGPCCPVCAVNQVYAPMERWGVLWRCDCGYEQPDDTTQDADRYERELAEGVMQTATERRCAAPGCGRVLEQKPNESGWSFRHRLTCGHRCAGAYKSGVQIKTRYCRKELG